ncbi:glycosyltransferase family 2 protein [Thiomicrorhabdus sp. 6S3-12]|uniref:glycosyltransferase family 2 protein n=1 Tax=Thiomicrorhabdus sp. 6S3-12 TaxID=2819681 RepID=UPI001AACEADF|nr:glycosyltransferase family 2 protein [Thiomicrorhabdus sp. 6S3-12]MBO1922989.1 glycosyltransferase family 2 protein [Thiomicrorhabdus sp. 6S3-12]
MVNLSIIIPAYNASETIGRCLMSILNQSTDFVYEIILVNDGSMDHTGEIARSIATSFDKLKVVDQCNKGVSSARNKGLSIANGKWVTFVDSDDFVVENYFDDLSRIIKSEDVDLIVFNYSYLKSGSIVSLGVSPLSDGGYKGKELVYRLLLDGKLTNSPCDKVFKRDLIGSIKFDEGISIGEDLLFLSSYLACVKCFYFLNKSLYIYDKDSDGITGRFLDRDKLRQISLVVSDVTVSVTDLKVNDEIINQFIFRTMLGYFLYKDIFLRLNDESSYLFREAVKNLRFDQVSGFKKKVFFFLLKSYVIWKFK